MGIFASILGGGIAEPIKAIGNIIDDVYTSDEEKLDKKEAMARLAMKPHMVQTEINKVEAQHRSVFVAGWRPFIGWICGAGLCMSFIINPLIQWYTGQKGAEMPLDAMMTLVTALLGLGAMRTFEKMNGKSK
jgi:hypothetical protein